MSERLRIEDVAQAAGVSKATVSQVLRNTGRISARTRDRVLRAVNEIGYVYNRTAANLRAGRSSLVGIGVSTLTNPFFADLVAGASEILESEGFFPMIATLEDDLHRQDRFATSLRENGSAGAILCPAPNSPAPRLAEWKAVMEPCVTVLRPPPPGLFDFVGVDNETGTRQAAAALIAQGHRHVGYLGGTSASLSRQQRLAGWKGALAEAGLAAADDLAEPCEGTITAASQALERLLDRHPGLTAVICHQDVVAYGATIGLRKRKLEPGRDVSVVGFDDITMSRDWDPPLTTVSVTPRQLGAEAARLLIRRIAEPQAPIMSVLIQPELIVRRSSGPPPGDAP